MSVFAPKFLHGSLGKTRPGRPVVSPRCKRSCRHTQVHAALNSAPCDARCTVDPRFTPPVNVFPPPSRARASVAHNRASTLPPRSSASTLPAEQRLNPQLTRTAHADARDHSATLAPKEYGSVRCPQPLHTRWPVSDAPKIVQRVFPTWCPRATQAVIRPSEWENTRPSAGGPAAAKKSAVSCPRLASRHSDGSPSVGLAEAATGRTTTIVTWRPTRHWCAPPPSLAAHGPPLEPTQVQVPAYRAPPSYDPSVNLPIVEKRQAAPSWLRRGPSRATVPEASR